MAEAEELDNSNYINLIGPDGKLGSVPPSEANKYFNVGYKPASDEDLKNYSEEQEFGTPGQKAIAIGEQALSAATLHGSELAETKLGLTTPERIESRARQLGTPGVMASQAAGLIGSSLLLPGEGVVGILGKVGDIAADVTGLRGATSLAAKIGSSAVKSAAENAFYESSNEGVKALQGADQSFGSVVSNIGLAAAIGLPFGGGLGAVHPLWAASQESSLGQSLKSIADRLGGVQNASTSAAEETALRAGIKLSPEAQSIISKDPMLQHLAQPLQDSQTGAGESFQKSIKDTKSNITNALLESIGKSPEDIEALHDFSENKAGQELQSKLSQQIKATYEPIARDYDMLTSKYAQGEFGAGDRAVLAENFAKAAADKGWSLRPSSPEAAFINSALKDISVIDNLNKLKQFGSSLKDQADAMHRFDISRDVRSLFSNAEDAFVRLRLGEEAPDLLTKYDSTNLQYRHVKDIIDELESRLKPGKSYGPGTFIYQLNDMVPEQVLNRLAQTKDASFIEFLNKNFPEVQKSVSDYQLNKLLKASAGRLGEGEAINPTSFLKKVKALSPELRDSIIAKESQGRIGALSELWDGLHGLPRNYSNTAATFDKMMRYMPASAAAAISAITGHNPIVGAVIGHIAEKLGRDVPDAIRLGLIKFLGSNKEINSAGFKSAVEFIDHALKGENLAGKAVKNIFKSGQLVLPEAAIPTEKDRLKLDKILKGYQENPEEMFKLGGSLGHYMEDHAGAQAKTAANAMNILNSLRPTPSKQAPLDSDNPISKAQKAEFDRILDIAQQPLMALKHAKDGTLQPKDMQILTALFPEFHQALIGKISNQMVNHLSKNNAIPYNTKMGLSLFMGQALDSTMTPQAIQATQPLIPKTPEGQETHPKHSMTALNKMASAEMTPQQNRQRDRAQK